MFTTHNVFYSNKTTFREIQRCKSDEWYRWITNASSLLCLQTSAVFSEGLPEQGLGTDFIFHWTASEKLVSLCLCSQPLAVSVAAFSLTCPQLSVTAAGHLPETRATPTDSQQQAAPQRAPRLGVSGHWAKLKGYCDSDVQLKQMRYLLTKAGQYWLCKYDKILDQITPQSWLVVLWEWYSRGFWDTADFTQLEQKIKLRHFCPVTVKTQRNLNEGSLLSILLYILHGCSTYNYILCDATMAALHKAGI